MSCGWDFDVKKAPQGAFLLGEGQVLAAWMIAVTALGDCPIKRDKSNIATTMFARSRLPRSLLTAHSVPADVGFVGD